MMKRKQERSSAFQLCFVFLFGFFFFCLFRSHQRKRHAILGRKKNSKATTKKKTKKKKISKGRPFFPKRKSISLEMDLFFPSSSPSPFFAHLGNDWIGRRTALLFSGLRRLQVQRLHRARNAAAVLGGALHQSRHGGHPGEVYRVFFNHVIDFGSSLT